MGQMSFLFLVLLSLSTRAWGACPAGGLDSGNSEILTLSCEITEISQHITAGEEVVPRFIYHYGKRQYMDENVKARTVPQEAWDKFIMGDITRYDLQPSRRGLYGTNGLDTNGFGYGEYSWLTRIAIKEECRQPERVAVTTRLAVDSRFKAWLPEYLAREGSQQMTLEQFTEQCNWDNYQGETPDCEAIAGSFFKDKNIAVLQDSAIQKSFYIRDRSCIETIEGTPSELLTILARNPNLWQPRCGSNMYGSLPGIIFIALLEAGNVDPVILEALDQSLTANAATAATYTQSIQEVLKAKIRCQQQGKPDFQNFAEEQGEKLKGASVGFIEGGEKLCVSPE